MDVIYFLRIICYMIASVYILKPGAEKQANVLKRGYKEVRFNVSI